MRHVAIIGGGFSGTLQAVGLLRHGSARVTLIERAGRLARGAAFSTRNPEHLLNVRAAAMSALPDQPCHFADWLAANGGGDTESFAQRRAYGTYVQQLLKDVMAEAGDRLVVIEGEAVDVRGGRDGETVMLADGRAIAADAVILSVGNLAPEVPRGIAEAGLEGGVYIADPWAGDIAAGLGRDDNVLLLGTGLTAIDAALILDAAGFRGRIVALSRRGLVPRAHADPAPAAPRDAVPEPRCSALLRSVRADAESLGWRAAVDRLRPVTQALWAAAAPTQRRRFLRHMRPWWDVHRHRIAPEIAAALERMEADGRLVFRAGKLLDVRPSGDGAAICWRPRATDEAEPLHVRRIVNCTGPQGNVARAPEPLLASLLAAGRIRPDPCRIGIDVDADCRTLDAGSEASGSLFAIGPMTRGTFWEIVAVPDIRVQVDSLARRLS